MEPCLMVQKLKVRNFCEEDYDRLYGDQEKLTTALGFFLLAGEFMTFKNGDELRFGTETITKVEVRYIVSRIPLYQPINLIN